MKNVDLIRWVNDNSDIDKLRAACVAYGLPPTGNTDQLKSRLRNYLGQNLDEDAKFDPTAVSPASASAVAMMDPSTTLAQCPQCGETTPSGKFCIHCGTPLAATPVAQTPAPVAASPAPVATSVTPSSPAKPAWESQPDDWSCPHCGTINRARVGRCRECNGRRFDEPVPQAQTVAVATAPAHQSGPMEFLDDLDRRYFFPIWNWLKHH